MAPAAAPTPAPMSAPLPAPYPVPAPTAAPAPAPTAVPVAVPHALTASARSEPAMTDLTMCCAMDLSCGPSRKTASLILIPQTDKDSESAGGGDAAAGTPGAGDRSATLLVGFGPTVTSG